MITRLSLDAQIDGLGRAIALTRQNPARQRTGIVEYEVCALTAAVDTLAWLRDNEPEVRAYVADRRGARR